jgi:hypothetical protein
VTWALLKVVMTSPPSRACGKSFGSLTANQKGNMAKVALEIIMTLLALTTLALSMAFGS